MTGSAGARVRRARPDDADGWAACYLTSLEETYRHLMPPEFFSAQAEQQHEGRDALAEAFADPGPDADAHWVAEAPDGTIVGVARTGRGRPDWQVGLGIPACPVPEELRTLYTLAASHGTGIGQLLLEAALQHRDAHLWCLEDNPRAEAFYVRNGFRRDGLDVDCGPSWYDRPMFRMIRTS